MLHNKRTREDHYLGELNTRSFLNASDYECLRSSPIAAPLQDGACSFRNAVISSLRTSTIRLAALPSQKCGGGGGCPSPRKVRGNYRMIFCGAEPTKTVVPCFNDNSRS